MSDESKSSYGTAFFIRMGVLLVLLLVAGGAMAYDYLVLQPASQETIERVVKACTDLKAEQAAVREAAGSDPTSTEVVGKSQKFEIDEWKFGRVLPFLEGSKISVVYLNGKVTEYYQGGIPDAERERYE